MILSDCWLRKRRGCRVGDLVGVKKIYCDESRQNGNHQFRLLGSIWIDRADGWPFIESYLEKCRSHGRRDFPSSVSFKDCPSRPDKIFMRYYEALLDTFFEYAERGLVECRVIIVSKDEFRFDHPEHNAGDFETGFSKLYYQLIVHRLSYTGNYHVRLAQRPVDKSVFEKSAADRAFELKRYLNNGFNARYGKSGAPHRRVVSSVEYRSAKDRVFIQLADVIMGAIGYQWNLEFLKPGAAAGKQHLCRYISTKLGRASLLYTSPPWEEPINIFRFTPSEHRKGAP